MKENLSDTFGIRSSGFNGMSYIKAIIAFRDQGLAVTSTGGVVQRDELGNLSLVLSGARRSDVDATLAQNAPVNVPFSFKDLRSAEIAALADDAAEVLPRLKAAHISHTMGLKQGMLIGFNTSAKGMDFNAGIAPEISYISENTPGGGKYSYGMDS